ncbi:LuxR C-terminal-related transcriptional regulator [Kushneria aurantia]|uniref:LuxR C-terminal-related transcriptional regulator n=1 Tax=Kushneria aurantia TaxID=504092 RepID=A0ABV6G2H6_9GAMM|nr:LuxR C-terminal-related transcriptional regulator [Kushneria aurantia]
MIASSDAIVSETAFYRLLDELNEGIIILDHHQHLRLANRAALHMYGVTAIAEPGDSWDEWRQRFSLRRRDSACQDTPLPIEALVAGTPFDHLEVELTVTDETRVQRLRGRVLDSGARPARVALFIEDITRLVSAEARFESAFNANPAPAVICRLDDLRFVRVNDGFLGLVDLPRHEVLNRSIYELDVFAGADNRQQSIRLLARGEAIPLTRSALPTADGGTRRVEVAGQPIDMNGTDCMLLTFDDLEPTQRARDAQRRSEAQFAAAFDLSPIPTALLDRHSLTLVEANSAYAEVFCGDDDTRCGDPPLSDTVRRRLLRALESEIRLRAMEATLTPAGGEALTFLISAAVVKFEQGERILLTLMDISRRKRSETELYQAIESVMQDASWFTQSLNERLAGVRDSAAVTETERQALEELSTRERNVLALLCRGLSDKRIASQLELAHSTVRNYVASIYRKLEVHSRSEAIIKASQCGFTQE